MIEILRGFVDYIKECDLMITGQEYDNSGYGRILENSEIEDVINMFKLNLEDDGCDNLQKFVNIYIKGVDDNE